MKKSEYILYFIINLLIITNIAIISALEVPNKSAIMLMFMTALFLFNKWSLDWHRDELKNKA